MSDTIAAPATPPGNGGIAIIRVSGPQAEEALTRFFSRRPPYQDRSMMYGLLRDRDGNILDECMAVMMSAPRTYTREDVAEFHLHGGPWIAQRLMEELGRLGIRTAEPGEFTKRAFLNGRIDLSRAEAVMAAINADSEQAARSAARQLTGGVSAFIAQAQQEALRLLAGVEAALDYPEEISDEEACSGLLTGARRLSERLKSACDDRYARWIDQGLTVVIAGAPNAGKSSLMNALTGEDRAIVTDIPGTTRDIVSAVFSLNGFRVTLLDTAGLRESVETIERIGVQRAKAAMEQADAVLLVVDASCPADPQTAERIRTLDGQPHLIVLNKCDLPFRYDGPSDTQTLRVSALTGEGIPRLKQALEAFTAYSGQGKLTSHRHIALAREAAGDLDSFCTELLSGQTLETAAVFLHQALDALGRVTGDRVDEKLLDEVFSSFCVGK